MEQKPKEETEWEARERLGEKPFDKPKWERHYRDDKGIWEDICPHGIGHEEGVHGCDGCCDGLYGQKPKEGRELRESISQILVKWDMPTRQVAIGEIVELIESVRSQALQEVVEKIHEEKINSYETMGCSGETDESGWCCKKHESIADFAEKLKTIINQSISVKDSIKD